MAYKQHYDIHVVETRCASFDGIYLNLFVEVQFSAS